ATGATGTVESARISPAAAARALDDARAGDLGAPAVTASGATRLVHIPVEAAVRVVGTYRLGGDSLQSVDALLRAAPLRLAGGGPLRELRLRVAVEDPRTPLEPPSGRSWRAFAATKGFGADPAAVASRRLLESALARQYRTFLVNPDPTGPTRTTYTVALGALPAKAATHHSHPWITIGFAIAALAALGAGIVAWAHS